MVVIKPLWIVKFLFITSAIGARQLVVQEAAEIILSFFLIQAIILTAYKDFLIGQIQTKIIFTPRKCMHIHMYILFFILNKIFKVSFDIKLQSIFEDIVSAKNNQYKDWLYQI